MAAKREIVRVASPVERAILEPHIERHKAYLAAVRALGQDPTLRFDPDTFSWWREVETADDDDTVLT